MHRILGKEYARFLRQSGKMHMVQALPVYEQRRQKADAAQLLDLLQRLAWYAHYLESGEKPDKAAVIHESLVGLFWDQGLLGRARGVVSKQGVEWRLAKQTVWTRWF